MSEGASNGGPVPRGASATGSQERTTTVGAAAVVQLDPMRFVGMSEVSVVAYQATALGAVAGAVVDIQLQVKTAWHTIGTVTILVLDTPYYLALDVAGRQIRAQIQNPLVGVAVNVVTILSAMA